MEGGIEILPCGDLLDLQSKIHVDKDLISSADMIVVNVGECGRSTLSQILCLRRIIEESQLCNLDLTLVFVDFAKAFDSVDRTKMFEILKLYGIPDKMIAAIRVLYKNTSSTILAPDGETPFFSIQAGILQGDPLAPFLFIIVVDYVLRMSVDTINDKSYQLAPKRSSRYPAKCLTDIPSGG